MLPKVFFIVPPETHFIESYVTKKLDKGREFRQKLGILAVAGYLRSIGNITPRIIDSLADGLTLADLRSLVKQEQPDIVGFSVLTFNLLDCLEVAKIIREVCPHTKVCFGGFHPTIYPNETLSLPEVDFVVSGEGEITFTELVLALSDPSNTNNVKLHEIEGLGWKDKKGELYINDSREVVSNLDTLPMVAHDLIDLSKYEVVLANESNVASIQTSRGCPFKCSFCDIRQSKYRYRSAEKVLDEMIFLKNLGIKELFIIDDTFTVNRKRVIELCKLLINERINIKFKISSRVDTIDQEMLDLLAASGCYRIHYGVETGSQRLLDYLEKGVTIQQIVSGLEMTKESGIEVFAYMMIGIPTETRSEIDQSVNFVKILKPDYVDYSICTPFPKTKLYEISFENDHAFKDYWGEFARKPDKTFKIRNLNNRFTEKELRRIQDVSLRKFYSSPSRIVKEIYRTKSLKQLAIKAKTGVKLLLPRVG